MGLRHHFLHYLIRNSAVDAAHHEFAAVAPDHRDTFILSEPLSHVFHDFILRQFHHNEKCALLLSRHIVHIVRGGGKQNHPSVVDGNSLGRKGMLHQEVVLLLVEIRAHERRGDGFLYFSQMNAHIPHNP